MTEKKPETLDGNLSAPRTYNPNPSGQPQETFDFNKVKTKLEDFKKKIIKKFPFTVALGILPPNAFPLFEEDEGMTKEEIAQKPIHLMMIIPEDEYKHLAKIKPEVIKLAVESGEKVWVHIKSAEVDIWNYGLDSKYEFIDAIGASYPLHDRGFLGALRVASIHKNLTLNWLNVGRVKYVATYGIFGSLTRGTADETSDVDVTVIIDDTDVKRMSRVELLEKLRGRITYDFIKEATALAGVKNILNVQVWLLTDFWQRVKDAEPVAFTFIRDGVPMYDRGTFIPWKRLLQMGKIKPSPEAIDLYMKEGERTEELIKRRMMDAMVDAYFGVVTPTQAMMMMAGHAPPVPKVIVAEVKKVLVDKEKLMTAKDLKTLEKLVKHYKDYEHGKLKEISGKEIDDLVKEGKEYNKRMRDLRVKLEQRMREHQVDKIQEEVFSLMKNIFGNKSREHMVKELETKLAKKGKIPLRMAVVAKEVADLKKMVKGKNFRQSDMQRIIREAYDLTNSLTEYAQRKELVSMEKGIAKINYEKGWAEIVATDDGIFVVTSNKDIYKIKGKEVIESTKEEIEKALKNTQERLKFDLPSEIIEILKKKFGVFSISF